ncbi:CoB--CoM heterodisulfide reductase iron-sulfur subunit B family protein [Desulfoplanes formicivorans]|uniref:CoB--CoM heterodisulfide reductase n=1 Tax=Desulfoplanes formicivorans TaxID=1592317 RepID=A0A194AEK9_9BACT|nr:CoB--CoM heterodisulfide reductase iron-sulfur subunit B family protein [Desulfoplanes formicivorans]GAU07763.1 CoB--CoM heterodisulfide reductase [Desulfoplanes formicivorans]
MNYAYFPGCKIPYHLPAYGKSVKNVCAALDIGLTDIEFSCCGWPLRHRSFEASMYAAARNLALAERENLPIMTPCKCCFGNLKHAQERLARDQRLYDLVATKLAEEGLQPAKNVQVRHLLTVLDKDVGIKRLGQLVVHPLTDLTVACHYGCHALRPSTVTGFDDPFAPTLFERIIQALGASTVDWDLRLECCGYPLRGRDDVVSTALMRKKLENVRASKAQIMATACTYCQMQFEQERDKLPPDDPLHTAPKAVLFTQLMEKALRLA